MNRTLLIMGPTASGKSALALALAERLGGEIVNADSKQVYRGLRVLTARPAEADLSRAPHHLYGFVEPDVAYSAGAWAREAARAIADIQARGKLPIVAGGTGLYFKALTEGLAAQPTAAPEVRARYRAELEAEGPAALHARLAALDPQSAVRIAPADAVRILRALELIEAAGAPLAEVHAGAEPVLAAGSWAGVTLCPPRDWLYAAIEARFAAMLAEGALAEAEAMAAQGLDPELPAMKAHGLPWLIRSLRGEMGLGEAEALSMRDTRRYAKRQFTWMAGQMAGWARIEALETAERLGAAEAALAGETFPPK